MESCNLILDLIKDQDTTISKIHTNLGYLIIQPYGSLTVLSGFPVSAIGPVIMNDGCRGLILQERGLK
jgi:hypothetical protein